MHFADRYAEFRKQPLLFEKAARTLTSGGDEITVQAQWFAGQYGREFTTLCGKAVTVVHFGVWNREAGADFVDCVIQIDGMKHRGSIELDLAQGNWEAHGHATNPAFEDTILHVVTDTQSSEFFCRTSANRIVPEVVIPLVDEPPPQDLPPAIPGKCIHAFQNVGPEKTKEIIQAAAEYRIQKKSQRLAVQIETRGLEQAVFQVLAESLGYKNNRLPFTLIAQRLPVSDLHKHSTPHEALLFGISGFLHESNFAKTDLETRKYLRGLWDEWWIHRDGMERLVLDKSRWNLSGTRPINHPQRRLGALASVVNKWKKFISLITSPDLKELIKFLESLEHDYWSRHYTLLSKPSERRMALIGRTRASELVANLAVPLLHHLDRLDMAQYVNLGAQLTNRVLETASVRLFGSPAAAKPFTRTLAQQQGLIQLYQDFCMSDDTDCQQCPFPQRITQW